jgi:single-stranded DNA-binding protein
MPLTAIAFDGVISQDAELTYPADGLPLVTFELAWYRGSKSGASPIERVERVTVRFRGKSAETFAPWLRKGTPVAGEGYFDVRPYTQPDGSIGYAEEIEASVQAPTIGGEDCEPLTVPELLAELAGWGV